MRPLLRGGRILRHPWRPTPLLVVRLQHYSVGASYQYVVVDEESRMTSAIMTFYIYFYNARRAYV